MKKSLFILFLIAASMMSLAQTHDHAHTTATAPPAGPETIKLKESNFDFGKIAQGRPVTHNFEIVNIGKDSLKLENVQASCGCTTPEWSSQPIAPGASTTIKVGYNAAAEGAFSKTVNIIYNGNQTKTIIITGNVYKAPATSAPVNTSLSLLKGSN